jgi:flagellar biosynthesis GTPase FlhF
MTSGSTSSTDPVARLIGASPLVPEQSSNQIKTFDPQSSSQALAAHRISQLLQNAALIDSQTHQKIPTDALPDPTTFESEDAYKRAVRKARITKNVKEGKYNGISKVVVLGNPNFTLPGLSIDLTDTTTEIPPPTMDGKPPTPSPASPAPSGVPNEFGRYLISEMEAQKQKQYEDDIIRFREFNINKLKHQEELEEARKKAEEAERIAAEEEKAKRLAEEKAKRAAEEEKTKQLEEEKAKRLEEEKAKRLEEEKAKRTADEEAAKAVQTAPPSPSPLSPSKPKRKRSKKSDSSIDNATLQEILKGLGRIETEVSINTKNWNGLMDGSIQLPPPRSTPRSASPVEQPSPVPLTKEIQNCSETPRAVSPVPTPIAEPISNPDKALSPPSPLSPLAQSSQDNGDIGLNQADSDPSVEEIFFNLDSSSDDEAAALRRKQSKGQRAAQLEKMVNHPRGRPPKKQPDYDFAYAPPAYKRIPKPRNTTSPPGSQPKEVSAKPPVTEKPTATAETPAIAETAPATAETPVTAEVEIAKEYLTSQEVLDRNEYYYNIAKEIIEMGFSENIPGQISVTYFDVIPHKKPYVNLFSLCTPEERVIWLTTEYALAKAIRGEHNVRGDPLPTLESEEVVETMSDDIKLIIDTKFNDAFKIETYEQTLVLILKETTPFFKEEKTLRKALDNVIQGEGNVNICETILATYNPVFKSVGEDALRNFKALKNPDLTMRERYVHFSDAYAMALQVKTNSDILNRHHGNVVNAYQDHEGLFASLFWSLTKAFERFHKERLYDPEAVVPSRRTRTPKPPPKPSKKAKVYQTRNGSQNQ